MDIDARKFNIYLSIIDIIEEDLVCFSRFSTFTNEIFFTHPSQNLGRLFHPRQKNWTGVDDRSMRIGRISSTVKICYFY